MISLKMIPKKYHIVLFVSIVALALLVASPALQQLIVFPQPASARFSELGLLGPNHVASDYPSDVKSGENYSVFLDVSNQLGRSAFYMIQLKFLDENQFAGGAEAVPALYNVTCFVADKQTWELPIVFSLKCDYLASNSTVSQINVNQIVFNGLSLDAKGRPLRYNAQGGGFLGYLVFELWIYDDVSGAFVNHNRSVDLRLNVSV